MDAVGPEASTSCSVVSDAMVREVVLGVLEFQVDHAVPEAARLVADDDLTQLRFEDLGIDSLLVAEVIVELEQRLGCLLELRAESRLVTLADLCTALRPVSLS